MSQQTTNNSEGATTPDTNERMIHNPLDEECGCEDCCAEFVGHVWVYEDDDSFGNYVYCCNHCGAVQGEDDMPAEDDDY